MTADRAAALRSFNNTCDGLVDTMQRACVVSPAEHPVTGHVPYYGIPVRMAVWYAKETMRQAQRLGLYPSTAHLEAEVRKAA